MGVHDLKQELRSQLPGLSALTMKFDNRTQRQGFTATVSGVAIPIAVAGNASTQETIAAILDGVKQAQSNTNNGATDNV